MKKQTDINKVDMAIVKLLVILAYADGNFSLQERKFVKKVCEKFNLKTNEYSKIKKEVQSLSKSLVKLCIAQLDIIKTKSKRNMTIKMLVELAAADNILHEDEIMIFTLIADEWGMFKKK